jgi:hypothetical protein
MSVSFRSNRDDRQHQMARMLLVVIDLVHHRVAAANVIRCVFDIVGAGKPARQVEARDVETDAVPGLEQVGGRQDLDLVFFDLARLDRVLRGARKRMPRPPRLRALRIERAVRGLQPAAGQFALGQIGGNLSLARPRGVHRNVGADVLEDDDPVGVVPVDGGVEVQRLQEVRSRTASRGSRHRQTDTIHGAGHSVKGSIHATK